MQGFNCSTPLLLTACAFPAVEKLAVVSMPLAYMDLEHLSVCTQLTSLELDSCNLTAEIASSQGTSTSPLAAVSSIRRLKLNGVSSTLARGLTQLTSLHYGVRKANVADFIGSISGMCSLQELHLVSRRVQVPARLEQDVSMPMWQQLVTTSAQLRVLELPCSLGQQQMDLLLTHATQLTHLTCAELGVKEDRSQSACSWAELETIVGDFSKLAYLPLHNIQRLEWGGLEVPSPCLCMEIILFKSHQDGYEAPARIRDAVTNLGRCPAWQLSGPAVKCTLDDYRESIDDSQSLVETVAALSGLTNKQLQLSISSMVVLYDAALIEQLGRALGTSLIRLDLSSSNISRDFWPAVWAHLPGLQQLSLGEYIHGTAVHLADLAAFCTHAPRPLQLCLDASLEEALGSADLLQELGSIWGRPQVTVSFCGDDE
jgi:hypothetical protein